MISAYGSNEKCVDARNLFDQMPVKGVFSWNSMISAYTQNGHSKEALCVFREMDLEGVRAEEITFATAVDACAGIPSLRDGEAIHRCAADEGLDCDVVVGSALINMYSKCGRLDRARGFFEKMAVKNTITWNTLITAYARNAPPQQTLQIFQEMQQHGIEADDVTTVCVLLAYSHGGLVAEGLSCFVFLVAEHGIRATMEHYKCVADLLCRAGREDEARELIRSMPFYPDSLAWMILVGSCKSSWEVGGAAARAFELDPSEGSLYVLLSNLCKNSVS
ncbi:hypothetical protein SELMODRAFT_136503 [Selaginella moellendorffii]|uniref:Pentacotripeptide-repeat region of PRORP domain-containing protein n=3 Tax=Selaginella moellendorffii TaxID=88036 RepID=D8TBW0_SELML|nr:hypothetical protein SELMODRAFT_136503 [Selaginella moellendorffii]